MTTTLGALSFRFALCVGVLAFVGSIPAVHAQDVQALEAQVAALFDRSCTQAGCHVAPVPQAQMNLTRDRFFAETVGEPSLERPELMRVHPGQPDSSYLVMKVKGDPNIIGSPMPFAGERLTEEEIQTIEQWVAGLTEADLDRKEQAAAEPAFPFTGWKVVNLPTSRTLDRGSWLFLISHRFNPKLSDGYEAFYGLDGSGIIYLSLGYALTDDLLVALARSNAADNVELQARYRFLQQGGPRNLPVGLAAQTVINWVTEKPLDEDSRFRGEAFKFTGQVALTRELGGVLGLAVVPGITFNPAEDVEGEDLLVTIGLGGRWRFARVARTTYALVGEWVPIVSGYTRTTTFGNDIRFDSWGGGLEIDLGGHVFQIVLSNTVGLTSDQYLRGGDLDLFEGDMRLGFNIFRILNF